MKNKLPFFIISLFAVLLVYGFFQLYERVEETVDLGLGEKALRNPYLAAELFLQQSGIDVESSTEITLIDELQDHSSLYLAGTGLLRNEKRINQVLDWVQQGGRLILAVNDNDIGSKHGLLQKLGVAVEWIDTHFPDLKNCNDVYKSIDAQSIEEAIKDSDIEDSNAPSGGSNETSLPFSQAQRKPRDCLELQYLAEMRDGVSNTPFYVHIPGNAGISLKHSDEQRLGSIRSPAYQVDDEAGTRFVQLEVDAGLVSVIADPSLWTSRRIGLFDNAHLLWSLADQNGRFFLLRGSAMPSLLVQLWRSGKEMIIVGLLALLAWIWRIGKRNQPAHDPVFTERRSIEEHLSARADFLWNRAEFNALLGPLKHDIIHHCNIRIGGFQQADIHARIEKIATLTGIDPSAVSQVFATNQFNHPGDCEHAIRIAQQIRNRL